MAVISLFPKCKHVLGQFGCNRDSPLRRGAAGRSSRTWLAAALRCCSSRRQQQWTRRRKSHSLRTRTHYPHLRLLHLLLSSTPPPLLPSHNPSFPMPPPLRRPCLPPSPSPCRVAVTSCRNVYAFPQTCQPSLLNK